MKRSDSGESDRRLTVLSFDHGKLDLIAKGARKGGSRLAGISEPLTLAKFHYAIGRQRRFVTQVEPLTSFAGLRRDYTALLAGLAWVELLDRILPYESPAEEIAMLGKQVLLEMEQSADSVVVLAWGMAVLLENEGHNPDWMTCVVTGVPVTRTPVFVSAIAGGHVSEDVAAKYQDRFPASSEALIAIKKMAIMPNPPQNLKQKLEVLGILGEFWTGLLERPLPALRTLRESQ